MCSDEVKVITLSDSIPSSCSIVNEAIKKQNEGAETICIRLPDKRFCIVARTSEDSPLGVYILCNSPDNPACVSWTTEHFITQILPPESINSSIFKAFYDRSPATDEKYTIRYNLVFLDADGRTLFVTAQRGLMDAKDFEATLPTRNKSLPPFPE